MFRIILAESNPELAKNNIILTGRYLEDVHKKQFNALNEASIFISNLENKLILSPKVAYVIIEVNL